MEKISNSRHSIDAPWVLLVLLGLYLTFEGYRSFEGDQAYRLPLLVQRLDPQAYKSDPFVRAFDQFNPHSGYLRLLEVGTRLVGLPATLFLCFCLTFLVTGVAVSRLTQSVWPASGAAVGTVAFGLVLLARAGHIGTNHLFEAILLDRLMALSLGWTALASLVFQTRRTLLVVAGCVLAANFIHPSLGLQLGLLLAASWAVYAVFPGWVGISRRSSVAGLLLLLLALVPAILGLRTTSKILFAGLEPEPYQLLAAYVQSPQHMVPHLWRMPQWLAWFAYLVAGSWGVFHFGLGGVPVEFDRPDLGPRRRLMVLLALLLVGLAAAWVAIELGNIRATLFQPFRMATLVRGLCLVLASGPVFVLWNRGTLVGRLRAVVLAFSLRSDWAFVWMMGLEAGFQVVERSGWSVSALPFTFCLSLCGLWIWQKDPEQGQVFLVLGYVVAGLAYLVASKVPTLEFPASRRVRLTALAWAVPLLALTLQASGLASEDAQLWLQKICAHVRVAESPMDDLERIATWCRLQTPSNASFIGPPGPKGFRLWSRRSVAFNRAGSPYHAAGLADWASRFQAHVGHTGDVTQFAQSYLANRQELERGYDLRSSSELVELAQNQGADHVLVSGAPRLDDPRLHLLHTEGKYSVYAVKPEATLSHNLPETQETRLK